MRKSVLLDMQIEKRLEDGAKRFDKLENMIWAVYPFILVSLVLSRFV